MGEALSWKGKLADQMPPDLAREIDIFETQIELRKQGKIEERVFAETRLRRGVYGGKGMTVVGPKNSSCPPEV